jgi:DNA transformation protein
MSVSDSFREFALEQLGRVTPVTARRMFGGVGIYAGGLFFAVMDNNRLYFKVDDSNRLDFEAVGMGPFRPFGEDGAAMQYYEVPPDSLEDIDALGAWVVKAIAVAKNKRARKKK